MPWIMAGLYKLFLFLNVSPPGEEYMNWICLVKSHYIWCERRAMAGKDFKKSGGMNNTLNLSSSSPSDTAQTFTREDVSVVCSSQCSRVMLGGVFLSTLFPCLLRKMGKNIRKAGRCPLQATALPTTIDRFWSGPEWRIF